MPSIFLEQPTPDTEVQSGLHAANYNDLQTLLNGGLDAANMKGAPTLTAGQTLVWDGTNFVGGAGIPTGIISPYAIATAPSGWLVCDGAAVSRSTYGALFTLISTAYGVGDGSTTFNVPDLRGRVASGLGTNATVDTVGKNDGVAVGSRQPKHTHTFTGTNANTGTESADHTHGLPHAPASSFSNGNASGWAYDATFTGGHNFTTQSAGRSAAHVHNITPAGTISGGATVDTPSFLVVSYIIKT